MSGKLKLLNLSLPICIALFLSSCSSSPPSIGMKYAHGEESENNSLAAAKCEVLILEIGDKRANVQGFGSLKEFGTFAESVPEWVESAVLALRSRGYEVSMKVDKDVGMFDQLTISVDILKAYMFHRALVKNANLVLAVNYFLEGKELESKVYRGNDTSVNWSSSPLEVEEAMNRAMNRLLDMIVEDLDKFCLHSRQISL